MLSGDLAPLPLSSDTGPKDSRGRLPGGTLDELGFVILTEFQFGSKLLPNPWLILFFCSYPLAEVVQCLLFMMKMLLGHCCWACRATTVKIDEIGQIRVCRDTDGAERPAPTCTRKRKRAGTFWRMLAYVEPGRSHLRA